MPVIRPDASGVYIISPTPFEDSGKICWKSTDRLVDYFGDIGVQGITILGIMGEAPKLDADESLEFSRRVIKRAGALPVIVGVSAPGFAVMRALARGVVEAGAAAVMISPPSSCRTDEQIVNYYRQSSEAIGTDVPFVIQDFPLTTGVTMSASVIGAIIKQNPACVMLKHEDWPGLEKISAVRRAERENDQRRVPILCGNGGLFLDFELRRGADGAMTGYAFPELLVAMCRLNAAGKFAQMHDMFDAHLPLIRYEQQLGIGLAVRKYTLRKRGLLSSEFQRAPRGLLSTEARAEIDLLIERMLARDRSLHLQVA